MRKTSTKKKTNLRTKLPEENKARDDLTGLVRRVDPTQITIKQVTFIAPFQILNRAGVRTLPTNNVEVGEMSFCHVKQALSVRLKTGELFMVPASNIQTMLVDDGC